MTLQPVAVMSIRSRKLPKPSKTPSPAKTGPFSTCKNDAINAGTLTASCTAGAVPSKGTNQSAAAHCPRANKTPMMEFQTKIRSATFLASFSPDSAHVAGTKAEAVPCIAMCTTIPTEYSCIAIPYAAADTPDGSNACARRAAATSPMLMAI